MVKVLQLPETGIVPGLSFVSWGVGGGSFVSFSVGGAMGVVRWSASWNLLYHM